MCDRLLLAPRHRRILTALLREHLPDVEVWAYGSRVNGTAHEGSDLDLVLRGPGLEEIPAGTLADFSDAVRESTIPILVEARDWARLPTRFQSEIERRHIVLMPSVHKAGDGPRRNTGIHGSRTLTDHWSVMPFSDAFMVNPAVSITRGAITSYVDMAAVEPSRRDVRGAREREFRGSGSRFHDKDVLFARITPCLENGKIARYRAGSGLSPAHGSTEFIVLRGRPDISDSDYAFYVARSPTVRDYAVGQMAGTSGRQRVPADAFDHLELAVPPLTEQRAIAHVLGALDDKIELNRRMNDTLESMARALFKSWFVDFDPVRAKMEGRDTGLPPHIANLFPNRLVPSELGDIPEGWKAQPLARGTNLTMGQSPPGSTYNDRNEGLPFFQGRSEFGFRFPRKRRSCSAPKRVARADDTLVSVRAPVGDINMAWDRCCIGRGVAALRHKSGSASFTYHAAWALQRRIKEYENEGTVFGAINKGQFEALTVPEPNAGLVRAFDEVAAPVDARIRRNVGESHALVAVRDALIPKLLGGELRIPIVERSAETAA